MLHIQSKAQWPRWQCTRGVSSFKSLPGWAHESASFGGVKEWRGFRSESARLKLIPATTQFLTDFLQEPCIQLIQVLKLTCRWYRQVVLAARECLGLSKTPLPAPRSQNSHLLFRAYLGDSLSTNFTCKVSRC